MKLQRGLRTECWDSCQSTSLGESFILNEPKLVSRLVSWLFWFIWFSERKGTQILAGQHHPWREHHKKNTTWNMEQLSHVLLQRVVVPVSVPEWNCIILLKSGQNSSLCRQRQKLLFTDVKQRKQKSAIQLFLMNSVSLKKSQNLAFCFLNAVSPGHQPVDLLFPELCLHQKPKREFAANTRTLLPWFLTVRRLKTRKCTLLPVLFVHFLVWRLLLSLLNLTDLHKRRNKSQRWVTEESNVDRQLYKRTTLWKPAVAMHFDGLTCWTNSCQWRH